MSLLDNDISNAPAPTRPSRRLGKSMQRQIARPLRLAKRWREAGHRRRLLNTLGDRTLRDIGLGRGDVSGAFWDRSVPAEPFPFGRARRGGHVFATPPLDHSSRTRKGNIVKRVVSSGVVLMLVTTVAWGMSSTGTFARYGVCETPRDVLWHQASSRDGISLTCDRAVRQQRLRERAP